MSGTEEIFDAIEAMRKRLRSIEFWIQCATTDAAHAERRIIDYQAERDDLNAEIRMLQRSLAMMKRDEQELPDGWYLVKVNASREHDRALYRHGGHWRTAPEGVGTGYRDDAVLSAFWIEQGPRP